MREKFLLPIFLATCAAIFILYWQFVYTPVQIEIANMKLETHKMQLIHQKLTEFKNRYDVEEFAELTNQRLYELQKYLPTEMDADNFVAEIYRVAENNRILVNSVRVNEISADDSNLQRQSIQISVEGKYIPLLNFIREISDGERMTSLDDISISSGGDNFLECNLELLIYSAAPKN